MVGPGIDLAEARGHRGEVCEDPALGLVSLFEASRGDVEGSTATAIILDPASARDIAFETDHLGCRILALRANAFTYYAGAAWSKAGGVTTAEQWRDCVLNFRKELTR